jgi:PAS domain S-box-containing protein
MGLDRDAAGTIMFKQMVNGILNALLASFVVQGIRGASPVAGGDRMAGLSIRRLMFDAFLAVGLIAGLASMVVNSYNTRNEVHFEAGKELDAAARRLARQLERAEMPPQAAVDAVAFDDDVNLALYSAQGQRLAGRGELRSAGAGRWVDLADAFGGLRIWLPDGQMAQVARWRKGFYAMELPALGRAGQRIVIERAAAPAVTRIEHGRLQQLGLMTLVAMLSVLGAWLLSRWLTRPIVQLEALSQALAGRVVEGRFDVIEGSRIVEFDNLRRSLQSMADTMAANFRELRQMRDSLEAQVQERTAALRQREQALEEFKTTLDQTLDCIFMFDAQDLQFFYANRGALEQTGYSRDELFLLHPYDIKPDIPEAAFRKLLAPLLAGTQKSLTFEATHRSKQGACLPVEVFIQYVEIQNQRPRFVNIVRDITERQRLDRMKTEFVSTVSHELRTPLTSIAGALGLAMGGALGELPEPLRQMLDLANKNSRRLTRLIDDLLDMEKLAAGKMPFDLRTQPLMPLVAQAIDSMRAYGGQHRVHFALAQQVEAAQVHVDGERLQQVLANLLSNAAKFSPPDAQVAVAVSEQPGGWLRVEVRDQGAGVAAQFRDRIFQKFSQADASDTRQKGGTGLGLAISKELVERMGGRIGFESEEGQGARFYLELAPAPVVRLAA